MTLDLERQLAGYGEQLGTHVAPFSIDELAGTAPAPLRPVLRRRRGWAVAVAAAVAVLLLIGGAALAIRLLTTESEIVDEPLGQTISVVHEEGVAGNMVAMVPGEAGYPVIAYSSGSSLWVAECGNAACASEPPRAEYATLRTPGFSGSELSVALLDDGTAAIAYVDDKPDEQSNSILRYARSGNVVAIEEGVSIAGAGLAVAGNGLPVLAYWTWQGEIAEDPRDVPPEDQGELVILACGDASCTADNTRTVIDFSRGFRGLDMTVDAAGNPVLAYSVFADGENSVRVARCADPTCAEGTSVTTISDRRLGSPSLALDSANRPTVAFMESPSGEESPPVALLACGDPMCDTAAATDIVVVGGWARPQLALTPQDLPRLAWIGDGELWLVTCDDRQCVSPAAASLGIAADGGVAMHIGEDGRPIIAYGTGSDVALLRCADESCTPPETEPGGTAPLEVSIGGADWSVNTIVEEGVLATWSRVDPVLDGSGHPLIVYPVSGGVARYDVPPGETGEAPEYLSFAYELARCGDPVCGEVAIATSTGLAELYEATVIDPPDGLPVFVYDAFYTDPDGDGIEVARCSDPGCSRLETNRIAETSTWYVPIGGVGRDGLPVVVYQNFFVEGAPVTMATCLDPACADYDIVTIDLPGELSGPFSLVMDPEGLWTVAYAVDNGDFRLARCGDAACTNPTVEVFDETGSDGYEPAKLAYTNDGLPLVAFDANNEIKVAACHDLSCSEATVTPVGAHSRAWLESFMIGPDGNPILAYVGDDALWFAVCQSAACDEHRIVQVTGMKPFNPDIAQEEIDAVLLSVSASAAGLPMIVYQTEVEPLDLPPELGEGELNGTGNLVIATCLDPACLGG